MDFSIDPNSSLGSNKFWSQFYLFFWVVICSDLLDAVLDYFRGSTMPRCFQSTLLVLFFHKKTSPVSWVDFLPISLCNGNNKIFTKLLVLRLALLLPRIISRSKSRFVPSRVTHGNMLLVQELVYDLNRHTRGNNVVLKLYTTKAYNRIAWSYIIQMLQSFGFSEQWVSFQ